MTTNLSVSSGSQSVEKQIYRWYTELTLPHARNPYARLLNPAAGLSVVNTYTQSKHIAQTHDILLPGDDSKESKLVALNLGSVLLYEHFDSRFCVRFLKKKYLLEILL